MTVTAKALPATGDLLLHTGGIAVHGFSYNNGSGGAGVITIYDSLTATGTVIYRESVATVTAKTRVFNPPITAVTGVTVNISAASGAGSVWMGA
jgi:hypothetical protein